MTDVEITQADLKPCPFCGDVEPEMSYYSKADAPTTIAGRYVECVDCGASGPGFDIQGEMPDRDEYTQSTAIDAWNTRADEARNRLEERAKIVAWLRNNPDVYDWSPPTIAAAIVDEEHLG